jgi:hypothetical protein
MKPNKSANTYLQEEAVTSDGKNTDLWRELERY